MTRCNDGTLLISVRSAGGFAGRAPDILARVSGGQGRVSLLHCRTQFLLFPKVVSPLALA